jgi:hypothetical protein
LKCLWRFWNINPFGLCCSCVTACLFNHNFFITTFFFLYDCVLLVDDVITFCCRIEWFAFYFFISCKILCVFNVEVILI